MGKTVRPVIPASAESGGPFEIGDELSVFDAAMVYSGRHPGGVFLSGETKDPKENFGRASLEEYEIYLGRTRTRGGDVRRELALNIYCELLRRIEAKEIVPLKRAYQPDGSLDPRDTLIRTTDLAKLAEERGESPEYLDHILSRPMTHSGGPGRPSSMHLIVKEMHARAERGELCPGVAAEAKALIEWLKAKYPHMSPAGPKSVENAIRADYRRLKQPKA